MQQSNVTISQKLYIANSDLLINQENKSVVTHVTSIYANLMQQKKYFA